MVGPRAPQGSKPLVVKFADSVQPRADERRVFVGGISPETTEEAVLELFRPHGDIQQATLHKKGGEEKGGESQYAFIRCGLAPLAAAGRRNGLCRPLRHRSLSQVCSEI